MLPYDSACTSGVSVRSRIGEGEALLSGERRSSCDHTVGICATELGLPAPQESFVSNLTSPGSCTDKNFSNNHLDFRAPSQSCCVLKSLHAPNAGRKLCHHHWRRARQAGPGEGCSLIVLCSGGKPMGCELLASLSCSSRPSSPPKRERATDAIWACLDAEAAEPSFCVLPDVGTLGSGDGCCSCCWDIYGGEGKEGDALRCGRRGDALRREYKRGFARAAQTEDCIIK